MSRQKQCQESTLALNPLTRGPGVRLRRERFSSFAASISEEMGVMLWGRNGDGVEELDGIWRVNDFRTGPLLMSRTDGMEAGRQLGVMSGNDSAA